MTFSESPLCRDSLVKCSSNSNFALVQKYNVDELVVPYLSFPIQFVIFDFFLFGGKMLQVFLDLDNQKKDGGLRADVSEFLKSVLIEVVA